ncbi:MAG TPA: winged helix DNA-binding domain-containing protein [Anaerolineales bacterium]|nr:winged helix DNA-binding domain-containing protein [Anaerolineales bacterium]
MISLNWGQVNAWRISQHYLTQRLPNGDFIQATRQTLGVHAQVMSAAEMAIAARVDGLSPQDIQSALWQTRSLVKTWMMRQTLHLVPTADFPLYIAARQSTDINWPEIFRRNGIDRPTFDAYLEISPEVLTGEPLTRQQFIEQVSERVNSPELHNYLVSGSWGTAFKPLAWRGELCFGPGNGQNATFVKPRDWIGSWQEIDPETALQEVLRRYLMVYGPARIRNFQVWWWMSGVAAKKAFDSIADETEEVEVEGWRSIALKATLNPIQEMEPTGEVHLLPPFDVYTVGSARGKDLEQFIALEHQKEVYRPQGWVSAVVLVDGFIRGIWEHKIQKSKTTVSVNLFSSLANAAREKIAIEADRLGKFLNTRVILEFIQP